MKTTVLVALLLSFCLSASADVRLPSLFGDHMILQQQCNNTIWGFAKPGEKVTVKASWGSQAEAVADDLGDWKAFLETPAHGTGHSLTISGDNNTIEIADVAIGEVWLCAGQSNMGWALGQTFGGEEESAAANAPGFRIFKTSREHWHEPLKETRDRLAKWSLCDPESAAATSAVSYYFGKTLHDQLDIPVGIIVTAYAGTPIEGWMPWGIQQDDPRTQAHKAALDENAARQIGKSGLTREKALATFDEELKAYQALIEAGETMKNAVKQLAPPIITQPANLGHQYPGHIYNAMIHPVSPYGIRGMIWYQGERNAKNVLQAVHYRQQLPQMIDYYRSEWHELSGGNTDPQFPCYFTQLPSWNPPQEKPVEGIEASWAVSREMMRLVSHDHPNTGMAVSIDTGDPVELHPKNKRPIGIRHALLALKQTYGKDVVDYGPRFRNQAVDGERIVLEFESTGSGLVAARSGGLDSFAIAGEDRVWHWADAKIDGDTVVVSSADVKAPVTVRYAWAMNPSQRNLLYNREGLPASPFRADDWPLFDPEAEIVEVLKPTKPEGYTAVDWSRPVMTQAPAVAAHATRTAVPPTTSTPAKGKPNFVLIFADDLGYGDVGYQGGDVATPHIDSIATNGTVFTDGYVTCPVCAPSRAGMLTGRYQQSFGFWDNIGPFRLNKDVEPGIPVDLPILSERLNELGYTCGLFGKTHDGDSEAMMPFNRWDGSYGFNNGASNYLGDMNRTHNPIFHNRRIVSRRYAERGINNQDVCPKGVIVRDAENHLTDALGDMAVRFIEANKDQPFLCYLPFNAIHGPFQAPQALVDKYTDEPDEKRRLVMAMLDSMDQNIGKVLQALRTNGLEENTLIVFLSDNGGHEASPNKPLRGKKGTYWEGGLRVPFCLQWKGSLPAGQTFSQPVISLDIMPTFIAAAGGDVDPAWKLDGVDLLPFISGEKKGRPHQTLYWTLGARKAIRQGNFKVMTQDDGKTFQMYNLLKDISEENDLAAIRPEKVKQLMSLHREWESGLMPQQWGWNKSLGYEDPEFGKPKPYHDPAYFSKPAKP